VAPEQQPPGQVAASQPLQTPATQTDAPPQLSQASPPVPQASAAVPGRHSIPWQQPSEQLPALHTPGSRRQSEEQPSPSSRFPSSQSSTPRRTTRSPQVAGSPSATVALTTTRDRGVTLAVPVATRASAASPSTRTRSC
jgi:hypothetical protein